YASSSGRFKVRSIVAPKELRSSVLIASNDRSPSSRRSLDREQKFESLHADPLRSQLGRCFDVGLGHTGEERIVKQEVDDDPEITEAWLELVEAKHHDVSPCRLDVVVVEG